MKHTIVYFFVTYAILLFIYFDRIHLMLNWNSTVFFIFHMFTPDIYKVSFSLIYFSSCIRKVDIHISDIYCLYITDLLRIPTWAATAAAVLAVGTLVQSPIPNIFGYLDR